MRRRPPLIELATLAGVGYLVWLVNHWLRQAKEVWHQLEAESEGPPPPPPVAPMTYHDVGRP